MEFKEADNLIEVTGIVLSASEVGDYDRRVVILTKERGKIHAFAKGARRPKSPLIGGIRPFCFGTFILYEGRTSYTIKQLSITNYFENVTSDVRYVYIGYYFLEFADYYSRENGDESETLKLLYQALRALTARSLDNRLVRLVYELKMMAINGDIDMDCFAGLGNTGRYALNFIIDTPPEKLFTFTLSGEVFDELFSAGERNKKRYIEKKFRSEEVLSSLNITDMQ